MLLECLEFAGQLIYCHPALEMGWLRLDASGRSPAAGSHLEYPGPFRFRVGHFFSVAGKPRGVLGQVEEPGHPFDSLFVVAGTGEGGPFDFAKRLCIRWDIEVGEGPIFEETWPRIELISPVHTGFGVVASSQAVLDETLGLSDKDSPTQSIRDGVGGSEHRVLEQIRE